MGQGAGIAAIAGAGMVAASRMGASVPGQIPAQAMAGRTLHGGGPHIPTIRIPTADNMRANDKLILNSGVDVNPASIAGIVGPASNMRISVTQDPYPKRIGGANAREYFYE